MNDRFLEGTMQEQKDGPAVLIIGTTFDSCFIAQDFDILTYMKQFILSAFTCLAVLVVQAQAKPPVQVQATQQTEQSNPLGLQQEEDVAIYPNPSNGVFTISVSNLETRKVELRILNVIGNEIYRETLTRTEPSLTKTINLDRYAKGLYYIKLEADSYSAVRRVVIK